MTDIFQLLVHAWHCLASLFGWKLGIEHFMHWYARLSTHLNTELSFHIQIIYQWAGRSIESKIKLSIQISQYVYSEFTGVLIWKLSYLLI